MKEKDPNRFSLSLLLIVTAISFLGFSGFIRLIDGPSAQAILFIKIALFSLALGIIVFIFDRSLKNIFKKDNKSSTSV